MHFGYWAIISAPKRNTVVQNVLILHVAIKSADSTFSIVRWQLSQTSLRNKCM